MLQVTLRTIEDRLDIVGGRAIVFSATATTIKVAHARWAATWTYRRPRQVSIASQPNSGVPIRDYVMYARIAIVFLAIAFTRRRS